MVRFVKYLRSHDKEPYVLTVDKRDLWKLGYGTIQRDESYVDVEHSTSIKHVRLTRPSLLIGRIVKYMRAVKSAISPRGTKHAQRDAEAVTAREDSREP